MRFEGSDGLQIPIPSQKDVSSFSGCLMVIDYPVRQRVQTCSELIGGLLDGGFVTG